MQSLQSLKIVCQNLIDAKTERDHLLYYLHTECGVRQKVLATYSDLSESRVKGIIAEQKRLAAKMTGEMK